VEITVSLKTQCVLQEMPMMDSVRYFVGGMRRHPSSLSVEWSAVEMPVLKEVILRTSRALSVYAHGALLSMI
jgi:hypothetical protein